MNDGVFRGVDSWRQLVKAAAKRILKEANCASLAFSLLPGGLRWILAALSFFFKHSKSWKYT